MEILATIELLLVVITRGLSIQFDITVNWHVPENVKMTHNEDEPM